MLLPTSVNFGAVPLGSTKRIAIQVENPGTADLHLAEVSTEAPFAGELLGLVVRPGEKVGLDLAFSPVGLGPSAGQLRLRSDAKDQAEVVVALSGEGVLGRLSAQPTRIALGTVVVGTERRAEVSLFNGGDAEVVGSLVAEGFSRPEHWTIVGAARFDEAQPFRVAPRGIEGRAITYVPLAEADEGGRLRFEICGPRCGPEIPVSATAVRSRLWIDPPALGFGAVGVGAEATLLLTVRGSAGPPVTVSAVSSSGPAFEVVATRGLPTEVTADGSLGLTVRFRPTAIGDVRAQVVLETNDPAAPRLLAGLEGEGVGPAFSVAPNPLHFGVERRVGQYRRTLLLISSGASPVVVQRVSLLMGQVFAVGEGPSLPLRLEGGESVALDVLFNPNAPGEFTDQLVIETDAGPTIVPLSGGVADRVCELELSPSPLQLGLVPVGSVRRRLLQVRNSGADPCEIVSATFRVPADPALRLASPFVPFTLAVGQQSTIEVLYQPTVRSEVKVILDLRTSDPAFPNHPVRIEGRSDGRGDCLLVQPDRLDFGRVQVGGTSQLSTAVSNVGLMPCRIVSTTLTRGGVTGFSAGSFATTVPVGASQVIPVRWAPTTATVATDVLAIETDDPSAPRFDVPLRGVSLEPAICVEPRHLDFGAASGVATRTFEIRACRSSAVQVHDLRFTTPAPELELVSPPALPFSLAPGQSQVITVRHSPSAAQAVYGVVTVASDDIAEPEITAGELIAPPEAGRYIYYWQIGLGAGAVGTIARLSLQGGGVPVTIYGNAPGQSCVGCHSISPDGRYLAMDEAITGTAVLDTTTGARVTIPGVVGAMQFSSWNPDVNAGSGYELVYSDGFDLHLASLRAGDLGPLGGANTPVLAELHPSWGPNGKIAFALGLGGGAGLLSPVDILEVDERGGLPVPVLGASEPTLEEYYPHYSPDGRWLAFTESNTGHTISAAGAKIRLVRTGGSGARHELPASNALGPSTSYPTWSVDSQYLSFSVRDPVNASFDLYVVPFDSATGVEGQPTALSGVNTANFEHGALWSR